MVIRIGVTQLDSQVTDFVGFIVFDEKQNFFIKIKYLYFQLRNS
ncbi:hypothetical protein CCP3SC1AL1_1730005 [Gammaproteobacteria bacterium]